MITTREERAKITKLMKEAEDAMRKSNIELEMSENCEDKDDTITHIMHAYEYKGYATGISQVLSYLNIDGLTFAEQCEMEMKSKEHKNSNRLRDRIELEPAKKTGKKTSRLIDKIENDM